MRTIDVDQRKSDCYLLYILERIKKMCSARVSVILILHRERFRFSWFFHLSMANLREREVHGIRTLRCPELSPCIVLSSQFENEKFIGHPPEKNSKIRHWRLLSTVFVGNETFIDLTLHEIKQKFLVFCFSDPKRVL